MALTDLASLSLVVRTYFVLASAAVITAQVLGHWLSPLLVYGKTQSEGHLRTVKYPGKDFIGYLSLYTVPRSWFKHFYLFSASLGLLVLVLSSVHHIPNQLVVLLLWTHSLRRMLETLLIERPSGSRMWVGHYIIGLSFYLFVNLAVLDNAESRSDVLHHKLSAWRVVLMLAFFLAQAAQHFTHRQLAAIRAHCRPGQYVNPATGLFRLSIAPHYTSEILMYFFLASIQARNISLWLVVIWTTVILGTSAMQTNRWGKKKFDDWGSRWVILPGLL